MEGWKYYNHAMIPTTAPHEAVNTDCIKDQSIWRQNRKALLARWTTDFDCGDKTNWWYVIKDTPLDISAMKSKRRYEINKGIKYFDVKEIDAKQYALNICDIQIAAYACYPEKYRPVVKKEHLLQSIESWSFYKVYGAFDRETGSLCAYAILSRKDVYISFDMLKSFPQSEPKAVNAAIVAHILDAHAEFFAKGGYICDGARNILHETQFQNYLEKYFGFRKAYCKMHIAYSPKISLAIKMLYPFHKLLLKLDNIGIVHQINGVLLMESIQREKEKTYE